MNSEEAKLILQAYRQGSGDDSEPQFRAALEHTQRDPELARWFAQEQALDQCIGAKIKLALAAPASLHAQLLAQGNIIRPVSWWQQPMSRLALAAGIALLLTIAAAWFYATRADGFQQYRATMADFTANKLDRLDLMSRDVVEVRRWLAQKEAHADLILPAGLEGRPSLGCRLLDWQGRTVSLICFELENRQVAHLLVVDSAVFEQSPDAQPLFQKVGVMQTAGWSRDGKTYLIASKDATQLDLMKLF
jgi:hypothetical protein